MCSEPTFATWLITFWFYRADRYTDRITEADKRYTHSTTVGVSNKSRLSCTKLDSAVYMRW